MNRYNLKAVLLAVITAFTIPQACKKNSSLSSSSISSNKASKEIGNITFTLKTTDMQRNTQSVFSQGENFIPTLVIANSSNQAITICHCSIIQDNPDLLGVYSNSASLTKFGDSAMLIGKPWKGISSYLNSRIITIPANSAYNYAIPWIADTTKYYGAGQAIFISSPQPPLLAGQYYLKFAFTYDDETQINLRYDFSFNNH